MKKSYLEKKKSIELKGVALLFMFWLHLNGHDNLLLVGNYYTSLLFGNNLIAIRVIMKFVHICVPIFIFISGYAFYINIENGRFSIKKTLFNLKKNMDCQCCFYSTLLWGGEVEI